MEDDVMTDKGKVIEAVYKADLSKRATLVVFYLINRANKDLTCFPAIKTIAADCNMSDRTVRRALDDLVASGFVKKEARYRDNGGQSSNLYTLILEMETKFHEDGSCIISCEDTNIHNSDIEHIGFDNYRELSDKVEMAVSNENSRVNNHIRLKTERLQINYANNCDDFIASSLKILKNNISELPP